MSRLNVHIILVAACLFAGSAWSQDPPADQKDKAQTTFDGIKTRFGDKAAVEKNLTGPLTGAGSFTTLNGATRFNQTLSCPSSQHYVEIFYGIGSGGDLSPVSIQQDSDFDGRYDHRVSFSEPLSAVCANGIISCLPGTFNDCRNLLWDASAGKLGFAEAERRELAGCYCVNNSCGNSLAFANRTTILDDLAGGVAGALQRFDARYAVSTVSREDFVIRLAGQDAGACRPAAGGQTQERYVDNAANLSSDAFAASTGDPIFGLVSNIPTDGNNLSTRNSCRIERQVTLDEVLSADIISRVTSTTNYGESGCLGDPDCFNFTLGDDKDDHIRKGGCNIFTEEIVWNIDRIDRLTEAHLFSSDYEDQIHISVNGQTVFSTGGFNGVSKPHKCQISRPRSININRSFKHLLHVGTNKLTFKIAVKHRGSGQIRGRIRYKSGCELVETLDDTCGPHAASDDCRLIEEQVDGVQTWLNAGRTGLTPLKQTRTLYGAKCVETFIRDWFERSRAYECKTDGTGARDFDFTRASHILNNAAVDRYSDLRPDGDGTLQTYSGTYAFDSAYGVEDCEQVCEVALDVTDNEVSASGTVSSLLKIPTTENTRYLTCSGNVCPLGPSETIKRDCGCLNGFTDALTIMQTFRLAGQDLTCTTGIRRQVQ